MSCLQMRYHSFSITINNSFLLILIAVIIYALCCISTFIKSSLLHFQDIHNLVHKGGTICFLYSKKNLQTNKSHIYAEEMPNYFSISRCRQCGCSSLLVVFSCLFLSNMHAGATDDGEEEDICTCTDAL
jgi:hypothetical protein